MVSPAAAACAAGLAVAAVSPVLAQAGEGVTGEPQVPLFVSAVTGEPQLPLFVIEGDAIPSSLTGTKGEAARGRAVVANRHVGLCLLCHSGPFPEERLQGTIAPDLRGAGTRLSEGQIRLRIADSSRINPDTIMPAYYRTERLARVAPAYRGKPILTAEQIEDVVAFLTSLRD
jgi:sulfur-oxidizing protein SoxX